MAAEIVYATMLAIILLVVISWLLYKIFQTEKVIEEQGFENRDQIPNLTSYQQESLNNANDDTLENISNTSDIYSSIHYIPFEMIDQAPQIVFKFEKEARIYKESIATSLVNRNDSSGSINLTKLSISEIKSLN